MTKTESPGTPKLRIKLRREYAGSGRVYRSTNVLAYIDCGGYRPCRRRSGQPAEKVQCTSFGAGADPDIQALLAEINADAGSTDAFKGAYSAEKAAVLKAASFDQAALGARGLAYEWLDQLTVELLLGVR